jgi:hypothetical protein
VRAVVPRALVIEVRDEAGGAFAAVVVTVTHQTGHVVAAARAPIHRSRPCPQQCSYSCGLLSLDSSSTSASSGATTLPLLEASVEGPASLIDWPASSSQCDSPASRHEPHSAISLRARPAGSECKIGTLPRQSECKIGTLRIRVMCFTILLSPPFPLHFPPISTLSSLFCNPSRV